MFTKLYVSYPPVVVLTYSSLERLIFHTEGKVFTNNILVPLLGLTRIVSNISVFTNSHPFPSSRPWRHTPLLPPVHKELSKLWTTECLLLQRDITPLPHPLCMTCRWKGVAPFWFYIHSWYQERLYERRECIFLHESLWIICSLKYQDRSILYFTIGLGFCFCLHWPIASINMLSRTYLYQDRKYISYRLLLFSLFLLFTFSQIILINIFSPSLFSFFSILFCRVYPLLGNDLVNTFPRKQSRSTMWHPLPGKELINTPH
jgi:hypothetical protein